MTGIGANLTSWLVDPARLDILRAMIARALPLVALVLLAVVLLGSAPAVIAEDDIAAARTHWQRGTRLYEVGDYREALDEFKAAHVAKPDPAFLYNIAQCHRQLGEAEQAITLYKRFLAASPNAPNRAEVERRVVELEDELAARKNTASSPVAPSPAQPSTPLPASGAAGSDQLPAAAPSAPAEQATPPMVSAARMPEPAGSSLRYLRWVGAGLTVALVGGAIVSGLSASSRFDDLKRTCGATDAGCSSGDIDGLKSQALLTNVLWGAAGVAAVGTGIAFYLAPSERAVHVAWSF
jgi:tetratricopeptide (TPR) repeat protein